jgi:thiamine biosynthesis protein ThiI
LGTFVLERFPARVDLKNPELTLFVDILPREAFIYLEKVPGPGGLPVGVAGRVIALLSGGIDSPVAAYISRLYLVPFGEVQQEVVVNTPTPYRVLLYRRLMARIAEHLAGLERAKALVTGESLGQVA